MKRPTEDRVALRYGGGYIEVSGHRYSVLVSVETKSAPDWFHLSHVQAMELAVNLLAAAAKGGMSADMHSCHDECQRPVCVLRRERDDLLEALQALAAAASQSAAMHVPFGPNSSAIVAARHAIARATGEQP